MSLPIPCQKKTVLLPVCQGEAGELHVNMCLMSHFQTCVSHQQCSYTVAIQSSAMMMIEPMILLVMFSAQGSVCFSVISSSVQREMSKT